MLKTVLNMLVGALALSAIGVALAQTPAPSSYGRGPLNNGDESLIDQKWLYGLAGGLNRLYQYGITAAGTTQATAKALPNAIDMFSIDTVGASTGINLPTCIQGTQVLVYNNTATTLAIYPAVANNPKVSPSAQDTINNGTSLSGGLAGHTAEIFFCPKNGVWAAK